MAMAALMPRASMPMVALRNFSVTKTRKSLPTVATFKNLKDYAKRKSMAFILGTADEEEGE